MAGELAVVAPVRAALVRLYYEALWARCRLGAATSDTLEASVGGVTATFGVPTTQEYFWVRNLENEEAAVVEDVLGELRDGDVFWDVGANIGLFSCFAGNAADVSIVAFEPYPDNASKLRDNLEYNSLTDRATVLERALGTETGTASLAVHERWDTMHSLTGEAEETVTVDVVRGDEVVEGVDRPDVVKIDVEGAEVDVLDGMGALLEGARTVYCEVHGEQESPVVERLEAVGFAVSGIATDGNTMNLVARSERDATS